MLLDWFGFLSLTRGVRNWFCPLGPKLTATGLKCAQTTIRHTFLPKKHTKSGERTVKSFAQLSKAQQVFFVCLPCHFTKHCLSSMAHGPSLFQNVLVHFICTHWRKVGFESLQAHKMDSNWALVRATMASFLCLYSFRSYLNLSTISRGFSISLGKKQFSQFSSSLEFLDNFWFGFCSPTRFFRSLTLTLRWEFVVSSV